MSYAQRAIPVPVVVGVVAIAAALLSAGATAAADGVLEINQACVATGCFAGDAPGWPVEIAADGSYRLTSNLEVPDENTTAITKVSGAGYIAIDLGGFAILGPNVCSNFSSTCTFDDGGAAISLGSGMHKVSNGSISGMGGTGIAGNELTSVDHVRVNFCGDGGISAGKVSNCVVSTVRRYGIVASRIARDNAVSGVIGSPGTGISTRLSSFNVVRDCTGFALASEGPICGYGGNSFTDNNGGDANPQVDNDCVELTPNVCGTDTICP